MVFIKKKGGSFEDFPIAPLAFTLLDPGMLSKKIGIES